MSNTVKKKHSIRTRIARSMIAVSLVSIFVLGTAAVSGLLRMRAQTQEITGSMGTQAAENSRAILESQAMAQLSA